MNWPDGDDIAWMITVSFLAWCFYTPIPSFTFTPRPVPAAETTQDCQVGPSAFATAVAAVREQDAGPLSAAAIPVLGLAAAVRRARCIP
jgi:hypothetical protein